MFLLCFFIRTIRRPHELINIPSVRIESRMNFKQKRSMERETKKEIRMFFIINGLVLAIAPDQEFFPWLRAKHLKAAIDTLSIYDSCCFVLIFPIEIFNFDLSLGKSILHSKVLPVAVGHLLSLATVSIFITLDEVKFSLKL